MTHEDIRIAAAFVLRADGSTLVVRKRGTELFIQPGGKIKEGEDPREALSRELKEELGLVIETHDLSSFGRFEAEAANEPGYTVVADVFKLETSPVHISAAAEIEELAWIKPADPGDIRLAVLTRDRILPLYRQTSLGLDY
ncbi:NUDIX hydrolase [Agrobacterium rosae]|uniref:NUDIX hydrolase n=1 Tax=Agrobacterium rosae TaxID=1972867 RepID=UPI003BA1324E